jgi:hypothetical protein
MIAFLTSSGTLTVLALAPIALLAIDYTRLHLSNKSQKLMVSSLMTASIALWIVLPGNLTSLIHFGGFNCIRTEAC